MAHRKHFSFSDKNIYDFVCNQRNASAYIEELVKKDMNKVENVTLEDVKRIVEQYYKNNPSLPLQNVLELK